MENLTTKTKLIWDNQEFNVEEWFLVGADVPVYLILASYFVFVLLVGPYLMKNRPPFKLTKIIFVYNIAQVIVSAFLSALGARLAYYTVIATEKCINQSKELHYLYYYGLHRYVLAKLSELLDTIFFVLRKKDRQITFLHVYHHSAIFLYTWLLITYEEAFESLFVAGFLNSFVHLVMYSYYTLSIFPSISKYLWWKKYITKLQMVQFSIILAFLVYEYITSQCKMPKSLFTHMLLNVSLVFSLFINFYRKTYKSTESLKNL